MQRSFALAMTLMCVTPYVGAGGFQRSAVGLAAQESAPRPKQSPDAFEYGSAVKGFQERATAYVALRKATAAKLPPLTETSNPAKIFERERMLAEAIAVARTDAAEGAVFGKDFAPVLIDIVRRDWSKRAPADRAGLLRELPKASVKVNQFYPTTLPLATFPPALIQVLPALQEQLEYRLVGHDIILRDRDANLVVDVLRNAIPTS